MSEKLKESLSAVIDGEADEFELRRVLDEVGKDDGLQLSWDRYHLIGSVMRGEQVGRYHGMRELVWMELQNDEIAETLVEVSETKPPGLGERSSTLGRWTSLAVAASVAFAVVVGYLQFGEFGEQGPATIADLPGAVAPAVQGASSTLPVALSSEVSPSDQIRTDAYKIYHMQQLGMNQSGFSGFARMVSYERN